MKTVQILVIGRVQGVGFRACVRRIASDMNIRGTVMNLPDSRVQIYATGEPMMLEKFVSMLYGCPRAQVRDIRLSEIPVQQYEDFSIIKNDKRLSSGL
ncbi:MAG: Acylphosphatase [Methanoregula sp. PtaU1.Bin051]|nr:MAG: Acylphosphatase [Methanoregula sp. PtaU1.Bin051]